SRRGKRLPARCWSGGRGLRPSACARRSPFVCWLRAVIVGTVRPAPVGIVTALIEFGREALLDALGPGPAKAGAILGGSLLLLRARLALAHLPEVDDVGHLLLAEGVEGNNVGALAVFGLVLPGRGLRSGSRLAFLRLRGWRGLRRLRRGKRRRRRFNDLRLLHVEFQFETDRGIVEAANRGEGDLQLFRHVGEGQA